MIMRFDFAIQDDLKADWRVGVEDTGNAPS
jgi:hypothetical protein